MPPDNRTSDRQEGGGVWHFPADGTPFHIQDNNPTEEELRAAVMEMSHGRFRGSSGIRAEHIKAWLRGAKKEEDLETAGENKGAGKTWR